MYYIAWISYKMKNYWVGHFGVIQPNKYSFTHYMMKLFITYTVVILYVPSKSVNHIEIFTLIHLNICMVFPNGVHHTSHEYIIRNPHPSAISRVSPRLDNPYLRVAVVIQ